RPSRQPQGGLLRPPAITLVVLPPRGSTPAPLLPTRPVGRPRTRRPAARWTSTMTSLAEQFCTGRGRQRRPLRSRVGDEAFAGAAAAGQPRCGVTVGSRPVGDLVAACFVQRQLLGSGRGFGCREPRGVKIQLGSPFRIVRNQFRFAT